MSKNEKIPDWVLEYIKEANKYFKDLFERHESRFPDWRRCLERYTKKVDEIISNPFGSLRSLEEIHNELCVADALLGSNNPYIDEIEYEPPLPSCKKTIDFKCKHGETFSYIDVKTISPETINRWDKFNEVKNKDLFAPNTELLLDPNYMGGERWHSFFTSRARMLEYTLELEEKISKSGLGAGANRFLLALCGDGVNWHVSQFEDFVYYYQNGQHRPDDVFSKMESDYVKQKGIKLSRKVGKFIYIERSLGYIQPKKVIWNVTPPK